MSESDKGRIIVYTDGCCLGNGKASAKAGVGVYFGPKDERNLSEPLQGPLQTNNRAELTAVIRALEFFPPATLKANDDNEVIIIRTDSKYVKNGVESWMPKWKRNGWRSASRKPVLNQDLWQTLDRLSLARRVRLEYIPAHTGIEGNEEADRLANMGAIMTRIDVEDGVAVHKRMSTEDLDPVVDQDSKRTKFNRKSD